MTGSPTIDAERAFARARRARRRDALMRRLHHGGADMTLPVYDERAVVRAARLARGAREIPLEAIHGTLEPARRTLFDRCFRPSSMARGRWERLWIAEHAGTPLPPIEVVCVADGFAVRDGHHRVSVARARGALTIDAVIEG